MPNDRPVGVRIFTVVVAVAGSLMGLPSSCGQERATASPREERSLIELKKFTPRQKYPLTLEEIVSLRKPTQPQISPDGKKVAFVVQQAFLERNENRSALFLIDIERASEPVKLLEEASLSEVEWTPQGDYISYISSKSGSSQVWWIRPQGGKPEQLTRHDTGVDEYAWSPDGGKIAFRSNAQIPESASDEAENNGIVYDEFLFNVYDSINNTWLWRPAQLWLYDVAQQKEEKLWELDQQPSNFIAGSTGGLAWSPDGRNVGLRVVRPIPPWGPIWAVHLGSISLEARRYVPVVTWNTLSQNMSWSPDGLRIAFISGGDFKGITGRSGRGLFRMNLEGGKPVQLLPPEARVSQYWWSEDGGTLLVERSDFHVSGIYEVAVTDGTMRKVSPGNDHLHSCSFDERRRRAACIRENSTTPPDVAVLDVHDATLKTLTALNPEYQNIRLGEVSFIKWKNKTINDGQGYLVKPLDYVPGQRYPLLIITYGFNGGFIWQAQWIPNYPVQVLAARGYAVLLANPPFYCPGYPEWRYGNWEQARVAATMSGTGTIESLLNAVQKVVEMGIADPNKLGIMGLSGGSDITDFVISHSNQFQAASSADGSGVGPAGYVIDGISWHRYIESITGGSPYHSEAANRLSEISPALNASRVKAPLLMEYVDKNIVALEFYTALKKQGKPVELVFYPKGSHIHHKPKTRLASMQRNLDWFNFWLLGKEDPDPRKAEQYARWRALRKQHEENRKTVAARGPAN